MLNRLVANGGEALPRVKVAAEPFRDPTDGVD